MTPTILTLVPKISEVEQVKELEKNVAASRKGLAREPSYGKALLLQQYLGKREALVREIRSTFRTVA